MKKVKTSWFMIPTGLAREVIWVNKKGKIVKRKIEKLKNDKKLV